jgi:hypothetical protein
MALYYAGTPTVMLEEPVLPDRLTANPDAEFDRPDWRWLSAEFLRQERAGGLALVDAEQRWINRRLDPLVSTRLLPFLAAYNSDLGPDAKEALMDSYPGIYWAVKTHESDIITRYFIEAFLMGGADHKNVAVELGTDPNYVWHYEKMFFDIADKRDNARWMEAKVVVPAILTCPTNYHRQGILWKVIALSYGWEVFSRNAGMYRAMDPQILHQLRELIHSKNNESALIVELTRRITRFTEGRIKEENLRQRELDLKQRQMDDDVGVGEGALETVVVPMVRAMSAAIGRPPAIELSLEEVKDDPDLINFKRLDQEIVEETRKKSRAPREEELSDES